MSWQKRIQLAVDPVAPMRLTDKIEHRQTILFRRMTQTSSQLLEKYRQAFSGSKEHDGIYFRHVKPLVQYIYRNEEGNLTYLEISQESSALIVSYARDKSRRRNTLR